MGAYVAYIAYVAAQRRGMVSTFTEMAENWLRQQATAEAQPEMILPADEPPPPLPLHDPAEWRNRLSDGWPLCAESNKLTRIKDAA